MVHLLVSELHRIQNARCNDKKYIILLYLDAHMFRSLELHRVILT